MSRFGPHQANIFYKTMNIHNNIHMLVLVGVWRNHTSSIGLGRGLVLVGDVGIVLLSYNGVGLA